MKDAMIVIGAVSMMCIAIAMYFLGKGIMPGVTYFLQAAAVGFALLAFLAIIGKRRKNRRYYHNHKQ